MAENNELQEVMDEAGLRHLWAGLKERLAKKDLSNVDATKLQSDYNQNDSTATDYIKNRQFYDTRTAIMEEQTLVFTEQEATGSNGSTSTYYGIEEVLDPIPTLVTGKSYLVEFNGTKYTVTGTAYTAMNAVYIGNLYLMLPTGNFSNTGEPFCVVYYPSYSAAGVFSDSEGSKVMAIYDAASGGEVVKLPLKYLPNTVATKEYVDENTVKPARFVVGTSANGWTEADCDYLCDGTADNVEINAAINALPSTGGEVILLDGTYNLSASINIGVGNTTLRGRGAKLVRAFEGTSANCGLIIMSAANCTVRDLRIDGVKATYSDSGYNYGIYVNGENNTVEDNYIENNGHCGIVAASGEGHIIKGNRAIGNGTYGIYLGTDHCSAIGNISNSNTKRGITTWGDCLTITGNISRLNGESNLHLYSSNYCVATGNNCAVLSADATQPAYAIRIQDSASTNNIVVCNQAGIGTVSAGSGSGNIVGNPSVT